MSKGTRASGEQPASATFKHCEIFALVALIYLVIGDPTAKLVEAVEARLDIYRERPAAKPVGA